jgi:hypothetical protein
MRFAQLHRCGRNGAVRFLQGRDLDTVVVRFHQQGAVFVRIAGQEGMLFRPVNQHAASLRELGFGKGVGDRRGSGDGVWLRWRCGGGIGHRICFY